MFQSRFNFIWTTLHKWIVGKQSSVIAIGLVLLLLLGNQLAPNMLNNIRSVALEQMQPFAVLFSNIVHSVRTVIIAFDDILEREEEIVRLKQQNQMLGQWQIIARRLEKENTALRTLANMPIDSKISYLTARLMTDSHPLQSGTVLLDVGSKNGVVVGAVLTDGFGVLGRISHISSGMSRVLLVTDLNSRIPVMIERTGERGILSGQQMDNPILEFIKDPLALKAGDLLMTVPDGGFMVPNLPVGTIKSISPHRIEIELSADIHKADYIRVLYKRTTAHTEVFSSQNTVDSE